jgi:hypothetical protein
MCDCLAARQTHVRGMPRRGLPLREGCASVGKSHRDVFCPCSSRGAACKAGVIESIAAGHAVRMLLRQHLHRVTGRPTLCRNSQRDNKGDCCNSMRLSHGRASFLSRNVQYLSGKIFII